MQLLLSRALFAGIASLALLAFGYPANLPVAAPAAPMSCCHKEGKVPSHSRGKPAVPAPQGLPCCPGCALAFAMVQDGAKLTFSLGTGRVIALDSQDAPDRVQPPPVPPPRSLAG